MLVLFMLPALLGIALLVDVLNDDDDHPPQEPEQPPVPDASDPLQVPDGVFEFRGTGGNDLIYAQSEGGYILGLTGNDTVIGSDANDSISGRSGFDSILAEDGDDIVWGGSGNDFIDMGAGDDRGFGATGDDTIYGGAGNDEVTGDRGNDVVYGGTGDDTVNGSYGNDLLYMGDGNDGSFGYGYSGQGDDTVYGGAGNDTIEEGHGLDLVFGEEGNDFIRVANESADENAGLRAPDTVDGGAGDDTIFANSEDVLTGGTGADAFRILNEPAPYGPVTITDFDPAEDVLQMTSFVIANSPDLDDFTFTHDAAANAVQLLRGTTVMATLQGLDASDIPAIEIVVTTPFEGR